MIEQVAKAMWDQRRKKAADDGIELEEWGDGSVPRACGVFEEARVAILAMREPSDAMLLAGAKWYHDNYRTTHVRQDTTMETIWQDMIDVILSGP